MGGEYSQGRGWRRRGASAVAGISMYTPRPRVCIYRASRFAEYQYARFFQQRVDQIWCCGAWHVARVAWVASIVDPRSAPAGGAPNELAGEGIADGQTAVQDDIDVGLHDGVGGGVKTTRLESRLPRLSSVELSQTTATRLSLKRRRDQAPQEPTATRYG